MLTTKILGKFGSIMVKDTLVSGKWASITNRSGLAHARLGTDSSRLNQEREWALGVW